MTRVSRASARRGSAVAVVVLLFCFAVSPARAAVFIGGLLAFDGPGGSPIASGVWQRDTTPYFDFGAQSDLGEVVGFSWAYSPESPDFVPDGPAVNGFGSHSVSLPGFPEGVTQFGVRAVDDADDWSPVATFDVAVDTVPDLIPGLIASEFDGGPAIPEGVPQPDDQPFMAWDAAQGTAPILGYSWALNAVPDGLVDTTALGLPLPQLPLGLTQFAVRAIDAAGNLGPVATFDIVVGTPQEVVPEPATLSLVGLGLLAVAGRRRRGRQTEPHSPAAP